MANVVKHRFASAKSDGSDPTQIQPSNWNDGHAFTGGNAGDVLTRDPTDALYGAKWAPAVATIQSLDTGQINDWTPAGWTGRSSVIFWAGGSSTLVTGLAGGTNGQIVTIKNRSANGAVLSFAFYASASAAANRFLTAVTSGHTPIAFEGWIQFAWIADVGAWVLIGHEQGAWIASPFSAADYFATGSMTWAVAAGNVTQASYRLAGRTLQYGLYLSATTLGGSADYGIKRRVFGGFTTIAGRPHPGIAAFRNGGAAGSGLLYHGGTEIVVYHDTAALTPWVLGATDLYVSGTVEVT